MKQIDRFDICIIGAGVIGLAIAYELAKKFEQQPVSIVLLERETSFGQHTSSRNSEVIHAGIYYPTNSLKAKFCVEGREMLYEHCRQYRVPHRKLGKLIVANEAQSDQLLDIQKAAEANGVFDLSLVIAGKLQELEPAVRAELALYSPSTGIIDSHSYMQSLLHLAEMKGVQFSPPYAG